MGKQSNTVGNKIPDVGIKGNSGMKVRTDPADASDNFLPLSKLPSSRNPLKSSWQHLHFAKSWDLKCVSKPPPFFLEKRVPGFSS
jgi:hypothetical protein